MKTALLCGGPWQTPVWLMLYSLHLSHFIRPESEASLMARWTWGLHSWWAAHIKWQPSYLWTDGASRLNSDVCFSATADTEMIPGSERIRGIHLASVWHVFVSKHHSIFSIFRANLCPGLLKDCWSYSQFQLVSQSWPKLYVTVIGFIHRLGLTWNLRLLSTDENKHRCWNVIHLIYCSWFNLIKCPGWLSGSQVKGIIHWRSSLLWVSGVICNGLRVAQYDTKGLL